MGLVVKLCPQLGAQFSPGQGDVRMGREPVSEACSDGPSLAAVSVAAGFFSWHAWCWRMDVV